MEKKTNIQIPIPEDIKWEAVGKGVIEALCEKQARIDRLEQLIFMLYENICRDVKSAVVYDDDLQTSLCGQILEKVDKLKKEREV